MMKRKITLKTIVLTIVLITSCLSFNYIIATLQAIRGLKKDYISSDLPISGTLLKGKNSVTKAVRNIARTELVGKYNYQENGMSPRDTMRMNNLTKSDRVDLLNINGNKNDTKTHQSKMENNALNGSISGPLTFIPKNSNEKSHIVPYLSEAITKKYLTLPEIDYTQNIVIVTPVRNAEKSLKTFQSQIVKLIYPHRLISVYFGESGSSDKTFEIAQHVSTDLKRLYHFRNSNVTNLNLKGGIHGNNTFRHKKEVQKYRRAHLAMARNHLLRYALTHGMFDHALWIDSDVEEFPADLIQQMLFANSDIVATSCLVRRHEFKRLYDCNSWRETRLSLQQQSLMKQDELVLECYGETERIFLPYLKGDGRVVKLDGVGGCVLMVKADCFRSGLQFPEVVYKRHIETEGLAKMALDMGYSVVGLPFIEVFHQRPSKRDETRSR